MSDSNNSRRGFLAAGATVAAGLGFVAIAPGIRLMEIAQARPAGEAATKANRWGMLVDTTKCTSGAPTASSWWTGTSASAAATA